MCSIVGMTFVSGHTTNRDILRKFNMMLLSGMDRGIDSTGVVAINNDGTMLVCRENMNANDFIVSDAYIDFIKKIDMSTIKHLIGNNRAQPIPEGDSSVATNRQPILLGDWAGSHNGTISNDKEIASKFAFNVRTQIDSEVVLHLFNKFYESEEFHTELVQKVCKEISGGIAFACATTRDPDSLYLFSNFKPLVTAYDEVNKVFVYNSEKKNIEFGFGKETLFKGLRYREIAPYTGMYVNTKMNIEEFPIDTKITAYIPEANKEKALVICSGGLDSCTAATVAKRLHNKEVTLLHFNYGQIAYEAEKRAILATSETIDATYNEIDMSWLGPLTDSPLVSSDTTLPEGIDSAESTKCWVPARNLLLLSVAAAYAESKGYKYVYSGFNLEESGSYPDNGIPFFKAINKVFQYGTLTRVQLVLVLERLMKPEIIKLGTHLGTPLDKTWSCDRNGELACGWCGCCWTRRMAYKKAGLPDPQSYLGELKEVPVWYNEECMTQNKVKIGDILNKVEDLRTF